MQLNIDTPYFQLCIYLWGALPELFFAGTMVYETREIKGFSDHVVRDYARIPQIAMLTFPRSPCRMSFFFHAVTSRGSMHFLPKTITLRTKAQLTRYNITAVEDSKWWHSSELASKAEWVASPSWEKCCNEDAFSYREHDKLMLLSVWFYHFSITSNY